MLSNHILSTAIETNFEEHISQLTTFSSYERFLAFCSSVLFEKKKRGIYKLTTVQKAEVVQLQRLITDDGKFKDCLLIMDSLKHTNVIGPALILIDIFHNFKQPKDLPSMTEWLRGRVEARAVTVIPLEVTTTYE
mmetsp:Transcript_18487/g.28374  ORF Transcript_18487/g.28374 Transcript_18487/m.28374 type:complete len:135 (+) Transcript_18487:417-821(+)